MFFLTADPANVVAWQRLREKAGEEPAPGAGVGGRPLVEVEVAERLVEDALDQRRLENLQAGSHPPFVAVRAGL